PGLGPDRAAIDSAGRGAGVVERLDGELRRRDRGDRERLERRRVENGGGIRSGRSDDTRQRDQGEGGGERRARDHLGRSHDPRTIAPIGRFGESKASSRCGCPAWRLPEAKKRPVGPARQRTTITWPG